MALGHGVLYTLLISLFFYINLGDPVGPEVVRHSIIIEGPWGALPISGGIQKEGKQLAVYILIIPITPN